jgi:hypothetical protein
MKKLSILIGCISMFVLSNIEISYSQKNRTEFDHFVGWTFDGIYMNDGEYMMSISPLSVFENYKSLYPDLPICEVELEKMLPLWNDKEYTAMWVIKNDSLYLFDVYFYCMDIKGDKWEIVEGKLVLNKSWKYKLRDSDSIYVANYPNRHIAIEKLTGKKFEAAPFVFPDIREYWLDTSKVIAATWLSGVLYVKKQPSESYTREHRSSPFLKLEFKNGKLVKKTTVSKMPKQPVIK